MTATGATTMPEVEGTGIAVGIDVGGSTTKAVVLDPAGSPLHTLTRPTNPPALMSTLIECIRELVRRLPSDVTADDIAVGVGMPGIVDVDAGTVRFAANLGIEAEPVAVAAAVTDAVGWRCRLENDANAAARGALALLAPPGTRSLAYLSVGTGIGAGLILDGRVWRDDRGVAGELGHVVVDPDGETCSCGRRGCLETVASGSAIARLWSDGSGLPPGQSLFTAAAAGDPLARRVREQWVGYLAWAVDLLTMTVDVDHVMIGGGVTDVGAPLVEAIASRLAVARVTSAVPRPQDLAGQLHLARHDASIGAVGAALLATEHRASLPWRS